MLPSSAARWRDAAESGPLLEKGDLCTARAKDIKNLKLLRGHGLIINYVASRPFKLRAIKYIKLTAVQKIELNYEIVLKLTMVVLCQVTSR